ncbi:hypothetical protein V5799_018085 [Amblyomma americanum]|uniref:RING-type domain-containing protein n=1 Tax=Amblyomma americanum TaxID=6943 RepID=A0AAQ4F1F1_AMBAM
MPPAGPQYTLVGFSPELDWRPLTFLKPIPANRVCSACGLVRKTSALLPCMHVLCEPCHQQCVQDGSQVCPLDGNGYGMEDVHMMECPADELLRREVKCWNEDNIGSSCFPPKPVWLRPLQRAYPLESLLRFRYLTNQLLPSSRALTARSRSL